MRQCEKRYRDARKLPYGLDNNMICAKDKNFTRGSDACQGDSGGPLLMITKTTFSVVGVTSFGKSCGGSTPGVYTSVFSYLDWIENEVWPDQVKDSINDRSSFVTTGRNYVRFPSDR